MTQSIREQADRARELAASYSNKKQDTSVDALLTGVLGTLQRIASGLSASVEILTELPAEQPKPPGSAKVALKQIKSAASAIAEDPIGFVKTEESDAVIRSLDAASDEIVAEADRCWNSFRASLDGQFPAEFMRAVVRIPGFAADARDVTDAWETIQRASELRRPDARTIENLRTARRRVDEGLQRLNAQVGSEIVRKQLSRAVSGTLPLTEVHADFVKWIKDGNLEQTFRVTVR